MTSQTFGAAINDALSIAMEIDSSVICYGLGVDDPKGVFGTTLGLKTKFGSERVFDIPTAENAMTGVGVGAAIYGLRPVITHQRVDFAILSMDQIINNAAKWRFMFGGRRGVPLTIRMIIGRGWGQGPTHSQSLQSLFGHIPGLKVVMPAMGRDAKGLLLSSIFDPDPVIFIEHRWLHDTVDHVLPGDQRTPIGVANKLRSGSDVTLVSMSYMTVEAIRASDYLLSKGVSCDLIDLRTVKPIDWAAIFSSVRNTGRLLVIDSGHITGSICGEIVATVATSCWDYLTIAPQRLASPDYPEATSPSLTKNYHVKARAIVGKIAEMLSRTIDIEGIAATQEEVPHDVPDITFRGPF
jgi:acetoin:2,6-dichlorophenolindophenol oxidoreductase subunit beta